VKGWRRALAVLALLLAAGSAMARAYEAIVTHVIDGDSLRVRPLDGGPPQELRLQGIDAPEGCQPHGPVARAALRRRVLGETVSIEPRARDEYQRIVARVRYRGEDVGGWLVERGHAWSQRYRAHRGPYAGEEAGARAARRGLWAAGDAAEPRQFRRAHGPCR
jgi:micrococcal nuclease